MISISLARPDEQAACLALLPEVGNAPVELIAANREDQLVGAAALVWESWARPAGFPVLVHVLPEARRSGVGRGLMAAAIDLIRNETDGLWSFAGVPEDGPAAGFLRACGFAAHTRTSHFEVEVAPFHRHLQRIVDRLSRNRRIPDDAHAVSLREAPLEEVAWLVGSEFSDGPARLLQRIQRGLMDNAGTAIDLDRSTVIMEGGQVVGALLYRWHDGHPAIEANVVAPARRHTYVNALQLLVATTKGRDGGATTFRFDSDMANRDSMNLARRGQARLVGVEARFYAATAAG